jgi:hypothetical protein
MPVVQGWGEYEVLIRGTALGEPEVSITIKLKLFYQTPSRTSPSFSNTYFNFTPLLVKAQLSERAPIAIMVTSVTAQRSSSVHLRVAQV